MDDKEEYSTCCGAGRLYDESDLCADCKEHTDFEFEEELDELDEDVAEWIKSNET